jgi:pyruvate/2-oxoglutarate dehydrogenase complex dihydrolipoamide acyltransferase (E2) component
MPAYYFVKVPKLPPEVSHQTGSVEVVRYMVGENQPVKKGQTIVLVQNWWARMALKAVGSGYVSKTFFDPHTQVSEGVPFAIVECDPEDGPKDGHTCELEVVERIREKPVSK